MLASDSLSAACWAFIAVRNAFASDALEREAASDSRDPLMRAAPEIFGGSPRLRFVPQPLHFKRLGIATAPTPTVATPMIFAFPVRFEVNDRGPGVTKGEEAKVFESFYRGAGARGATDTHAALGLGLALVQRIALAHGGRAFAESRPDGQGACIGFELPR